MEINSLELHFFFTGKLQHTDYFAQVAGNNPIIFHNLMSQPKILNVARIRELIEQGFRALKNPKGARQAVLVIGDTGVGKSTIISLLSGQQLMVKHNGLNTVLDSSDNSSPLKIGHQKFSETSVPTKVVIGDLDFFDCSGFKDNRGDEFQISNSFFLQRLFFLYQRVKIFLIIDEHYITEARLDKLPKLIHSLVEAFGNLKEIQDGVILLVNKARLNRSLKDYTQELERLIHLKGDKPLFSDDERSFLSYLINNQRLVLFRQADEADAGKVIPLTGQELLGQIKKTSFVKSKHIKNIISQSAKLSIRDYADQLLKEGEEKFDDLIKRIKVELFKPNAAVVSSEVEAAIEHIKHLLASLKKEEDWNIADLIKEHLPNMIEGDIGKDFTSILFLRSIYEKSGSYFTILKHKLISQLTVFQSELTQQCAFLKQREEELIQLKNKQVELEQKLQAEAELNKQIQQSAEALATGFKKKEHEFEEFKAHKKEEIQQLLEDYSKTDAVAKKQLSQKEGELKNIRSAYENMEQQYRLLTNNQKDHILELEENYKQSKDKIEKTESEKTSALKDITELKQILEQIRNDYKHKIQEIDILNIENESLKNEIENLESISLADSTKSLASKTHKYPDVVCPHFKNGGKCKHCINKWKESQKIEN